MYNLNGCLIQEISDLYKFNLIKSFKYFGLNAYCSFPLSQRYEPECRLLTNKHSSKLVEDNLYQALEFISDRQLMEDYIGCCKKYNIDIRVLFVESEYADEIWIDEIPELIFLGYEFCPIPIDNQIITDLDWFEPLGEFKRCLNQYGLFETYDDALRFKTAYEEYIEAGIIGDGEYDAYIFKVSIVSTK